MATFQTYQATGNREDLMDIITNISPTDTPMFSAFGKVHVDATYSEWQTDALKTATSNAQVEGADFTAGTVTATYRTGSYTQILGAYYKISRTEEAVSKAGKKSEVGYQKTKALKELANDIEYMLVNATGASGASGTARETTGVLTWITSVVESGSGTGSEALTESMLNDALLDIWTNGANPHKIYAGGYQKRTIATFTGLATLTRNIDAQGAKLVSTVDVYQSPYGQTLDVVIDRFMTTTKIAIVDDSLFKVGVLRPIKSEMLSPVGDAERFQIIAELSCISLQEKGHGQITGLSTS